MNAEQLQSLLQEIMARVDHSLVSMQPIEAEFKDPTPSERLLNKIGWLRKVSAEITPELYEWMKTQPDKYVLKGIVWVEEIEESPNPQPTQAKSKKAKKEKGEWGSFWQDMFLEGVIGRTDFKHLFDIPDGLTDWNKIVRGYFGLTDGSLTEVSPEQLIKWLEMAEHPSEVNPTTSGLIAKIKEVAGMGQPALPAGKTFSPAALRDNVPSKQEPTDQQFIKEHNMF